MEALSGSGRSGGVCLRLAVHVAGVVAVGGWVLTVQGRVQAWRTKAGKGEFRYRLAYLGPMKSRVEVLPLGQAD